MHKYVCTHAISDSGQRYRCPLSLARAWSAQQSPHHSHHSLNSHHTHHTRRISFGSAFGSTFWTTATSVPQHAGNLLTQDRDLVHTLAHALEQALALAVPTQVTTSISRDCRCELAVT